MAFGSMRRGRGKGYGQGEGYGRGRKLIRSIVFCVSSGRLVAVITGVTPVPLSP